MATGLDNTALKQANVPLTSNLRVLKNFQPTRDEWHHSQINGCMFKQNKDFRDKIKFLKINSYFFIEKRGWY